MVWLIHYVGPCVPQRGLMTVLLESSVFPHHNPLSRNTATIKILTVDSSNLCVLMTGT